MRFLVTGANGFVGQHLVHELVSNNIEVVGVGGTLATPSTPDGLSDYKVLDLTKPSETKQIDFSTIDGVIHLAGLAAVGPSFDDPMSYMDTNIGIQVNLFETALAQKATPTFLIISSGSLYDPQAPLPLNESSPILPSSPYAVSKIGQEQLGRYYGLRGFKVVIARPFNHIGPGQNPGFIVPDLTQQVIAFEKGLSKQVLVGNLDAERDYTDVRDIVRAYRLLLEKGQPGEIYNVCSGTPLSGHQILEHILQSAKLEPTIVKDPGKMRPSDTPILYGDHQKLTNDTGWQPEITIDTTMSDVVADWRQRT